MQRFSKFIFAVPPGKKSNVGMSPASSNNRRARSTLANSCYEEELGVCRNAGLGLKTRPTTHCGEFNVIVESVHLNGLCTTKLETADLAYTTI